MKSVSQRKTNIYHLYVESKKEKIEQTYLQNRNRHTDIENILKVTKEERDKLGVYRYTLLYIK